MLIPKREPLRDPKHLRMFRHMTCLASGYGECGGDVVGHHILIGWQGKSIKPPDNWTVPLCFLHHRRLHDTGERAFWVELFNESPSALRDVLRLAGESIYG